MTGTASGVAGDRGALPPQLLAISPGDLTPATVGPFEQGAASAIEGGLRGILLREMELPDASFLALAKRLRTCLAECAGWLGIHDRAHLVPAALADGLHLGFRSLSPDTVPAVVRERCRVGLSTHAGDGPKVADSVDYVFFGPIRATPSKEGWVEPVGFDGLAQACAASAKPVWALGGMEPDDGPRALASGAAGIAVLRGILGAPSPRSATAAYLERLEGVGS